jgi:hypothetical protein
MFVSAYYYVLLLLSATTTTSATTIVSATQCDDEPAPVVVVVVSSFEEYMVVAVEGTSSSSTTGSSFMTDKELYILEELLMLSYNELVHCPSDVLEKDGGIISVFYNMDDIGFVQEKENVWNKSQHVNPPLRLRRIGYVIPIIVSTTKTGSLLIPTMRRRNHRCVSAALDLTKRTLWLW